MAGTPLAELFARIGFQIDDKDLVKFEMRLQSVKGKLQALKGMGRIRLEVDASNSLRNVNQQLMEMRENLRRIKQASVVNPVRQPRQRSSTAGRSGMMAAMGGAIGRAAAPFIGVGAAYYGLKSIIDAGRQMQTIRSGLLLVGGSAAAAGEHMGYLTGISQELGSNFQTTASSYTKFMAAGRDTNLTLAAQRDIFKSTLEMTTVLGLSQEGVERSMKAMTQMLSKGTVGAEELRGQLGDHVPGAINMMAKAMNVTVPELQKLMKAGRVLSEKELPALASRMAEIARNGGALGASTHSLTAEIMRFTNSVFFAKYALSEGGIGDGLVKAMMAVNASLDKFREYAGGDAAKALGVLVTGLGKLLAMVITIAQGLTMFVKLLLEFKWLILGVSGAVLLMATRFIPSLSTALKALGLSLKGAFIPLTLLFLILEDLAVYARGGKSMFGGALDAIGNWLAGVFDAIGAAVDKTLAGIKAIKNAIPNVGKALDKFDPFEAVARYGDHVEATSSKPNYNPMPRAPVTISTINLHPRTDNAKDWAKEFADAVTFTISDFSK